MAADGRRLEERYCSNIRGNVESRPRGRGKSDRADFTSAIQVIGQLILGIDPFDNTRLAVTLGR